MIDIQAALDQAHAAAQAAGDLDELKAAESAAIGRNSMLAQAQQELGTLPVPDRRDRGRAVNEARQAVQAAFAEARTALEERERRDRSTSERLDLTELSGGWARGHLHLVTQTWMELEDLFLGMGYSVAEGPEIETDWYNFEALNMPPGHPARSMWDTLYVKVGAEESTLLRTHTSPVQVRVMQSQSPPLAVVAPGRCYRRDTPDARHLPVFHQIEGLLVDTDVTFGDLAGTIEAFTGAYFGTGFHSRLRPSFFPFTEPSAEFEVTCIFCAGNGCRVCSQSGWIELGGCGMVDPAVLSAAGLDPECWQGFAFGFGIDRCAMLRHGVDDLRHFITNDVRFLRQF